MRFDESQNIVHAMTEWPDESREARKGTEWMQMARDRIRFQRRIVAAGSVISPVLESMYNSCKK